MPLILHKVSAVKLFDFYVALQFLTRFPIRLPHAPEPINLGRSALFYPLVGALMGLSLMLFVHVLSVLGFGPWMQAAFVLALWVFMTGALHLDGFADSLDAWAGGRGEKDRTLELMKDPRSGPMAIVGLFLLLLLKFVALESLLTLHECWPVLLAAWLARVGLTLLLVYVPYVREQGLGNYIVKYFPFSALPWFFLLNLGAIIVLGWLAFIAAIVNLLVFYVFTSAVTKRIGGSTGDTLGAWVEISEVVTLCTAVWYLS